MQDTRFLFHGRLGFVGVTFLGPPALKTRSKVPIPYVEGLSAWTHTVQALAGTAFGKVHSCCG